MTNSSVISCVAIALISCPSPVYADGQRFHAQNGQSDRPTPPSLSAPGDGERSAPIKYIGNCESHKFHRPSCPFARIMALNKRVQFYYRIQAVACGHVPCRYCLPPSWTVVRGRLLTPVQASKLIDPAKPGEPHETHQPVEPCEPVELHEPVELREPVVPIGDPP